MIHCEQCEHFTRGPGGQVAFRCDPFATIKEPECLVKWQLLRQSELCQKVDRMVAAYEATIEIYKRLQPMQEKIFKHMEREITEAEESDAWKLQGDEDDEPDAPDEDDRPERGYGYTP